MKPSPLKAAKAVGGKKRAREEAAGSAAGMPPVSPPRPDQNREWKKSKSKTEDLLDLLKRKEEKAKSHTQEQNKSRCKIEGFLWSLLTYFVLH
jgi:hypothetical protein